MTLTAAELTSYRQLTGDEAATVVLSDDVIQSMYDSAALYELSARTTQAITVVTILERLWGLARVKVDIGNGEFEIEKRRQYFLNLQIMLDYWGGIAGAGGWTGDAIGGLSVGTIDLGLDQDELTA